MFYRGRVKEGLSESTENNKRGVYRCIISTNKGMYQFLCDFEVTEEFKVCQQAFSREQRSRQMQKEVASCLKQGAGGHKDVRKLGKEGRKVVE